MKYRNIFEKASSFLHLDQPPFRVQGVNEAEIREAEDALGIEFDPNLKEFWLDVGCGLIRKQYPLTNSGEEINPSYRFCDPLSIVEAIEEDPEAFNGVIPFFDIRNGGWFVIRKEDGVIVYDDQMGSVVANNVEEFIDLFFKDALYTLKCDPLVRP